MSINSTDEGILNKSNPAAEQAGLGTEVKSIQDTVTDMQTGGSFTLPTSDPSVAGALYSDSGTVKVSSG